MNENAVTLAELNQKIDALTAQVQLLTEHAQRSARANEQRSELLHDAAPIANRAMALATEHFQDIEAYVSLDDWIRLLKKAARHGRDFEMALDQIDGVTELLHIAGPISKDVFNKVETAMDDLDRKGYFTFARGGARIMDKIVTSFSEDDVRQLGDNVVLILRTVKDMTQPEVMNFLRSTINLAEHTNDEPVDISYRSLANQLRDPNMRRGLAMTLRVLSGIGNQTADKASK
jgi:uncharacterized protein YjgD (DUF1641 family)